MQNITDKRVLVCGGGGFIGGHIIKRLQQYGCWLRSVDLKAHEFSPKQADDSVIGDLRDPRLVAKVLDQSFDMVIQLAADMGGAGFIFTGDNDAQIMHNSALINLNILEQARKLNIKHIFYSSSACVYPEYNQTDPANPKCDEASAYPAAPDSEYGWEKLFSERLYLAYQRNQPMQVSIARYHNIFGPEGCYQGGREKAPAALCRKVAQAQSGDQIEVWGDGQQTRSFLYIDECVEATLRLINCAYSEPVNIGSEEMVTINQLAEIIIAISGKDLSIKNIPGPEGVRGRNSDNRLIRETLAWAPSEKLHDGLRTTYQWIDEQLKHAEGRQLKRAAGRS